MKEKADHAYIMDAKMDSKGMIGVIYAENEENDTMEGKIYEVHEDGSSELYLMIEGSPQAVQFQGKLMFIDGYDLKTPFLYDMEKEVYVEDEVLEEFVGDSMRTEGLMAQAGRICVSFRVKKA